MKTVPAEPHPKPGSCCTGTGKSHNRDRFEGGHDLQKKTIHESTAPHPTVARFAIDATMPPLAQDTLCVAEQARIVAMGCYRRAEEGRRAKEGDDGSSQLPRSPVFSGKDGAGRPLVGHTHAFYLPTDEDGDGRIDHLTIVAEMGFGPSELCALDRMRRLPRENGDSIDLLLIALGRPEDLVPNAVFGPSSVWESVTPFVATRHAKARGRRRDSPELLGPDNRRVFAMKVLKEEIERLCLRRPEIGEPVRVEQLNPDHRCGVRGLMPFQFKLFRRKRGDEGGRRAAGAFRIVFSEPVRGPIALGHSSHFGLGLFVAVGS